MRRHLSMRAGLPAVALSVLMAGCGGGSGGGDETPVVDLRDPSFAGPGGGAPAPAAAPAPAPAPAAPVAPVQGAPGGFDPAGGMIAQSGSQGGGPISSGPAVGSGAGGASAPIAAAPAGASATGGGAAAAGDLALNEMLSAANAANDPGAGQGQPGASGSPPQGSGPPGMEGSAEMMAMMAGQGGMMPDSSGAMAPGIPPGMAAGPGQGGKDYEDFGMQGAAGGQMGPGGLDGGFEQGFGGQAGMFGQGPGGPGASAEADDFESPQGAVEAFLDAIETRDIQRLQEATALRAPQHAETAARRKAFQAIREMSLTPEEFDEIADNMDGFKIARRSRPTEAGVLSFILQKEGEYGSTLLRTIDVRKERSGWKVLDVSGISEIKRMGGRAMEQRKQQNGGDSGGFPN